ncbi:MAG: hypothetical protein A07HB70_01849 [uncultured archaeon A07HB70]|nr:MAG: hypothetical protein A07HB70_01849 [uncultured archaeon A07HB70]
MSVAPPLQSVGQVMLVGLRMVVFALAGGITLISFQAYQQKQNERLESAFIGFAFISMGVAMSMLGTYAESNQMLFDMAEVVPFIVGFAMLWRSLYR